VRQEADGDSEDNEQISEHEHLGNEIIFWALEGEYVKGGLEVRVFALINQEP